VLGAGLGGLQAVQTAVSHPTVFGLVAAHSADLARNDEVLTRRLRLQATLPLRVHLAVGEFETAVDGRNLLLANQRFASLLEEQGYELRYEERPQGPSWGFWEVEFGQALRYFWGTEE
jgi:enterochelin esterase-like enzyme